MKAFLFVLIVFCSTITFSQIKSKDSILMQHGEGIVVKLKFTEKKNENKCNCIENNKICVLYKVEILASYRLPLNNLFDSNTIYKLKYISALKSELEVLNLDSSYIVALYPSTSSKYLSVKRVFNDIVTKNTVFYYGGQGVYFSDKFNCYKKRFWLIRFLYSKKNRSILKKDPFEDFISGF